MKKSEIKDIYNESRTALQLIKAKCLLLPYAKDIDELALTIAEEVRAYFPVAKKMCDYMIDNGSKDFSELLQEINKEMRQIESDVAKLGYSKARFILLQNCRAIINNIKDVEIWTQQPQQGNQVPFNKLFPEDAKQYFDRLVEAGFRNSNYLWKDGTQYQATQAAYNISLIIWKTIKWKPFETFWGLSNMAQTFPKNRTDAANKESIDKIDSLFPENTLKKELVKL